MTPSGLSNVTRDITECDREPIHIPGRIQRFASLFAFTRGWTLAHVSENATELSHLSLDALLGRSASDIFAPQLLETLRKRLAMSIHSSTPERLFGQDLFGDGRTFDIAIHESGEHVVLEAEPSGQVEPVEALTVVRSMLQALRLQPDIPGFLEEAARQVRVITGFDRVMVYRFTEDSSGEVVAEDRVEGIPTYRGLRYPATDIPQQARQLYLRNLFRIITDVSDEGAPIVPERSPSGVSLDLSMSVSRAVSPIHVEYLRNMGVSASLSISIVVDGALWGLFACHHMAPRYVAFDKRTAAELFAELFSLELSNRLRQAEAENAVAARAVHDKIMAAMVVGGSPFEDLSRNLSLVATLLPSDGVFIWIDGQFAGHDLSLDEEEAKALALFLNTASASQVFSTDHLAGVFAPAANSDSGVCGILAIPVSRTPRDYVVFCRRELARSVTWAGNPEKAVNPGADGERISPRKSFAAWREIVRDHSAPWSDGELQAAEAIRVTMLEVILRSIDHTMTLRKRAQDMQDLLIGELNHRVRNILALIRGVVRQTRSGAESVDTFAEVLGGRIYALARAHDQLTAESWSGAPLRALLSNEFAAYAPDAGRVHIDGPDVHLTSAAFTNVALVMHEMVTNSVKYGALSNGTGELTVTWSKDADGGLSIVWQESGGPPVEPPKRRGFGTTLIERAIAFELGGQSGIEFAPAGVRASFGLPKEQVEWGTRVEEDRTPPRPQSSRQPRPTPATGPVLLVEDNMVIAMDAEDMLRAVGFEDVVVVGSASAAMDAINAQRFSCAVLDINLGRETSLPVARALREAGIHLIFASGYGEQTTIPDDLAGIEVLHKPYAEERLRQLLLGE